MLARVAWASLIETMSLAPCSASRALSAAASFGGPSSDGMGAVYWETVTISARISAPAGWANAAMAIAARLASNFRIKRTPSPVNAPPRMTRAPPTTSRRLREFYGRSRPSEALNLRARVAPSFARARGRDS